MVTRREPQPGVPFSAEAHAYSYWLLILAWTGLVWLIRRDLSPGGAHLVARAYGVLPSWRLWALVIIQFMLSGATASAVSLTYYRFTGYHFVQDRIGFARAGGSDISNWCNILINGLFVCLFGFWLAPGTLGVLRPFVLVIAGVVSAIVAARVLATIAFRAQFGDPYER